MTANSVCSLSPQFGGRGGGALKARAGWGATGAVIAVVIAGLDPAIHPVRKKVLTKRMDPRVKPAGDGGFASRAAPHPALAALGPPSPRYRGARESTESAARLVRDSPAPLEAGFEALRKLARWRLAHRAGDAERPAEQLLLGAQRAQPLVVGARNVGAERHARVGRQDVEAQRLAGGPAVGLPRRVRERPRH